MAKNKKIDLDLYGISLVNIDGVGNLAYPFHIVNDLKLPYLLILDKDYFLPYQNDELNLSRNSKLTKITKHAKRHFWLNDVCTCHGLLPSHSA